MESYKTYLPQSALVWIAQWIGNSPVTIQVKSPRKSKLGDYRFYQQSPTPHQITINSNLKCWAFFFVLTHEIAHFLVWKNSKIKWPKPHGKEWQQAFAQLLYDSHQIYPVEQQQIILNHAKKPTANILADPELYTLFFNQEKSQQRVQDLDFGSKFRIGKKHLIKGNKRKIRYICREIQTNKIYSVHGLAKVDKAF